MTPAQYQEIWDDVGKWIGDDIRFVKSSDCADVLEFDRVSVISATPWQIFLNGRYDCRTTECTYNFVAAGEGAFSRFDVRGNLHRDAGRTHQHLVNDVDDIRQQLPFAVRRDDLESLNAKELWERICDEANIAHTGDFFEPEVICG